MWCNAFLDSDKNNVHLWFREEFVYDLDLLFPNHRPNCFMAWKFCFHLVFLMTLGLLYHDFGWILRWKQLTLVYFSTIDHICTKHTCFVLSKIIPCILVLNEATPIIKWKTFFLFLLQHLFRWLWFSWRFDNRQIFDKWNSWLKGCLLFVSVILCNDVVSRYLCPSSALDGMTSHNRRLTDT